jgi:hypothetical protein
MPYMAKGKTVYKKLPGGKRGQKVGTTKGSVKKYMAALYANTDKDEIKGHSIRKMRQGL